MATTLTLVVLKDLVPSNVTSNTPCPYDNTFGPAVGDRRGGFDFTLLFEQTILSIVPNVVLLLLAPFRIVHLLRSAKKTLDDDVLKVKAVSLGWVPSGCVH